jgi:hypothetical protein
MNTLNEKLAKILTNSNEEAVAKSFAAFCKEHANELPMPGENKQFDQAMWTASQFTKLSKRDEDLVARVTAKLAMTAMDAVAKSMQDTVLNLRDLVGSAKQSAVETWQDMLGAMSWQQMVPAGAMRGVGAQMVTLGTYQTQIADASVQFNLGWHVDKDELRLLVQAKDSSSEALSDVEVRITSIDGTLAFSRKTNEDGAVVAPCVPVKSGEYKIEILWADGIVNTPFFRV